MVAPADEMDAAVDSSVGVWFQNSQGSAYKYCSRRQRREEERRVGKEQTKESIKG